jgi:hypothetical protein
MSLFEKVKSGVGNLASQAAEACGVGMDAARGILEDIAVASTDLEEIGYVVRDIEVTVSVPPSVTVYLVRHGEPNEDAFGAALARRAKQRSAWLLLKMVQQANGWSTSLKFGGRRCRELAVDLGIRPAVRLMFGRPAGEGIAAPPPMQTEPTAVESFLEAGEGI